MTTDGPTGLREQKRQQTMRRIVDAGVKLFGLYGYETTTLDAIAAEAGISRRTFFHYFKSKDDILISMQTGLGDRLVEGLAAQPPGQRPMQAMRTVLLALAAPYRPEELIVVDRLMRSSETVQARKQASYAHDEKVVLAALRQRWPDEPDMALRLVATLSIATVRLSLDAWSEEGGTRPLVDLARETFDALATLG